MITAEKYLEELIQNARTSQREFETYSQERVDSAVRAVGKAIYDNAEQLARMAVDETRMGLYESKVEKCKGKSKSVWYRLKGIKSRGIIEHDEVMGIVKVAKPIGVVGAITPVTNCVITLMHNAMMSLKCGNAIVICPHPRAKKVGAKTVELMTEALAKLDMPPNLIQIIEEPTMELSSRLMRAADICISTGGAAMVKAAYSSGKPAYGVGAGNVQVLVDRDVAIKNAVDMVVAGRVFDNGILCTCEQNIIYPREKHEEIIAALQENNAYCIENDTEVEKLRSAVFPDGVLNVGAVGASMGKIAQLAGLSIPENTKLIACKTKGYAFEEPLAKEKMFPVLALFPYDQWEDAVEIARANLEMEGMGHSCVIHSNNCEHIEYVTEHVEVSRYLINQIGGNALGGALYNGLSPTTTLGCGSWGNNSISENLWYHHLMNVCRISYRIPNVNIPSDEEIWAEGN